LDWSGLSESDTPMLHHYLLAARMSRVPWNFGGGPLIVRPR